MLRLMFTDAENRGWANDFAVDGPDELGGTLCDPGGERAYGRPFVTRGAKVDVARRSILSLGGVVRVVAEERLAVQAQRTIPHGLALRGLLTGLSFELLRLNVPPSCSWGHRSDDGSASVSTIPILIRNARFCRPSLTSMRSLQHVPGLHYTRFSRIKVSQFQLYRPDYSTSICKESH
jgi:hypothetical protein